MIQGSYIMPPFNRFDMALKVMEVLPEFSNRKAESEPQASHLH
jgi:hypothetical protein